VQAPRVRHIHRIDLNPRAGCLVNRPFGETLGKFSQETDVGAPRPEAALIAELFTASDRDPQCVFLLDQPTAPSARFSGLFQEPTFKFSRS